MIILFIGFLPFICSQFYLFQLCRNHILDSGAEWTHEDGRVTQVGKSCFEARVNLDSLDGEISKLHKINNDLADTVAESTLARHPQPTPEDTQWLSRCVKVAKTVAALSCELMPSWPRLDLSGGILEKQPRQVPQGKGPSHAWVRVSTFWLCGTKTLPVLIVQLFQDAPRRIVSLRIKGTSWFSGMVLKAWPKRVITVATASKKCKQLIVWTQRDNYKKYL